MTDKTKRGLFYGWKMVWASFGLQVMQSGLLQQSLGAYVAVLREEFGWGKAALAGAAVIQQVENALLGPIQGWLIDRFGSRIMVRSGVIMLGVGFMLFSQVDSLTGFYAAFLVIALGSGFSGFFPLTVALMHWFEKKRARALSSMQLGGACGGMLAPLVALSMLSFGWRTTALAAGVLIILIGFPLASVIRRRPADIGEVVDGMRESPAQAAADSSTPASPGSPAAPGAEPDYTAGQAIRTGAFWFISLGHGLSLLVVSAVNVHAITHLKEGLGYALDTAALVMGLMTAGQFVGILPSGQTARAAGVTPGGRERGGSVRKRRAQTAAARSDGDSIGAADASAGQCSLTRWTSISLTGRRLDIVCKSIGEGHKTVTRSTTDKKTARRRLVFAAKIRLY